jgi:L-glyceraldehyde reductase
MSLGRTFKLNSGYEIPAVGLGTWVGYIPSTVQNQAINSSQQLSKPHEVENAVETALRKGYRHIDAAACYQNENEVGNGWKKSGVPREEIFVCSSTSYKALSLDI